MIQLVSLFRRAGFIAGYGAIAVTPLAFQTAQSQSSVTIRNNHEIPFSGAFETRVDLPDGLYRGQNALAIVHTGVSRAYVSLGPNRSVRLEASAAPILRNPFEGPLIVTPTQGRLRLAWNQISVATIDIALVLLPGTSGTVDQATKDFTPLSVPWTAQLDGTLRGSIRSAGYEAELTAYPYGAGMLDLKARVTRAEPTAGSAYLAIVRRVITPGTGGARLRFNGREFNGGDSPSTWDRDFWYTRGVDWSSWHSGNLSLLSVNGFSPAPTILHDSTWAEASHFYVWERTRQRGDTMYLVSEISGPNADQAKSRYMPVTPFAPVRQGDTVFLKSRLAISTAPSTSWAESQLRTFAGYRSATHDGNSTTIDLGVRSVSFGTSYFPYSTLAENFDYYRTPGLSSENFWPVSPGMWTSWSEFIPRMKTDLHIIRAMGFESVRLHHLELLRTMKQEDAFAFLDFFTNATRALGMHVLIDTEGPPEWLSALLTRYRNAVTRVEIENEVLIGGIKPSDPERWKQLYTAAKTAAPNAQIIFTAAGNNAMFERLRTFGVPFDRVGLHLYKHGPQWKEAYSSHVLGSAGYASDIGKPLTVGEFNWKDLTRMSPETRQSEVANIYETVLAPHAVPELFEFQFQETLTFNPSVAGSTSRHYEPVGLDRRPKAEAFELMRMIRKYGAPTAPATELSISVPRSTIRSDKGAASFVITNKTVRTLHVRITPITFDGLSSLRTSPERKILEPGASVGATVSLALNQQKRIGTYHHFIRADYEGKTAYGWGIASKPGAPQFSANSVLGAKVLYPQGTGIVNSIDWNRNTAVAFGAGASALELESAYQLATTLQSATGRTVRVSSVADVPDSVVRRGLVVLVGTPSTNSMIPAGKLAAMPGSRPGAGLIWLNSANKRESLVLTGPDARGVQAAVVELVLRFWPNAKDATMRVTGMEPGAALGHRAGGEAVDPP